MSTVTPSSTSSPYPFGKEQDAKTSPLAKLVAWLLPAVSLQTRYISWEEGEGLRSIKVLIKAKPGVKIELLGDDDARTRFKATLSRLGEHNYYQLKVWPRSTRDFAQEQLSILASLPNGGEKLYTIHACVE